MKLTPLMAAVALLGCGSSDPVLHAALPPAVTFADYGAQAVDALRQDLWASGGKWFNCEGGCGRSNQDWGNDSLTFTLYLRWLTTRDERLVPMFQQLADSATAYSSATCNGLICPDWSDMPAWDAVANMREHEVAGSAHALRLAIAAYRHVHDVDAFTGGACPAIRYQRVFGSGGGLKTLETDANMIKAALLLWQKTGEGHYLDDAQATYASVRANFLDPATPLYTVYVFDDGHACTQVPRRFFASVNGTMIWNGVALASATANGQYLEQALATAHAVDTQLSDGRGILADLQAENDVVEPLVEAFLQLATEQQEDFARQWLLRNAQAAIRNARVPQGLYGRFFNGPAPDAPITDWQTNGGLALAVAAAALEPTHAVAPGNDWGHAQDVTLDIQVLPWLLTFRGSGIALVGTLGEQCCEAGHVALTLDGAPMVDGTGIWQNKSSAGRPFPDAVLFAWQWTGTGNHRIEFKAPAWNAKEGGAFVHVQKYRVIP